MSAQMFTAFMEKMAFEVGLKLDEKKVEKGV